jgi:hypothetical protein
MIAVTFALFGAAPLVAERAEFVVTARREMPALHGSIVPDVQLATMRGGIQLPNGLAVSIGIDIQTRIDGVLALHTIFNSDGPTAGIAVYTDGTDSPRTAPGTTTVTIATSPDVPSLVVDRSPTGTTVTSQRVMPAATVNLINGEQATWLTAIGQTRVAVIANGPAVATESGSISLSNDGSGAVVTLDAPMLQVRQLIGQATGAVVANTGNDRVIDTVSSVNVDLQGLSPTMMAGIFSVQRAVQDALTR